MEKLKIYKNSEFLREIDLDRSEGLLAGRSDECLLSLDGEKGISRRHFKLSFSEQGWKLETLSRYGELYFRGDKVREISLQDKDRFSVPPYEFEFLITIAPVEAPEVSQPSFDSDFERTVVGNMIEIPVLTVKDADDETRAVFHLEGQNWVAGKDPSCALFIDNPQFSRFQFEIQRQENVFMIKNLSSSIETLVNGNTISDKDWSHFRSGDEIKVLDWSCYFELRDPRFQEKFLSVPEEVKMIPKYVPSGLPQVIADPGIEDEDEDEEDEYEYDESDAADSPSFSANRYQSQAQYQIGGATNAGFPSPYSPQGHRPVQKKSNFVPILIVLLLIGGGYFYLTDAPKKPIASQPKRPQSPFDKLTAQQQQYVRDSYRLAEGLFKQGRYELARQEISKVHQLVPYFEESKNIEQLAGVAIETEIEGKKAEERERMAAQAEQQLQEVTGQCSKIINDDVTMDQLEKCLSPVLALNPDYPAILALRAEVDRRLTDKAMRAEQNAEYQSRVSALKAVFGKAQAVEQSGARLEAIEAYEKVLSSRLPDPQDLRGKAKRQIASIREGLSSQQQSLNQKSEEAQKRGDLRAAYQALKDSVKIDPNNQSVKGRMSSILSELKKQMQTLYQEAILEESIGEVDTAKSKWKKIVELSVPDEEYYKKATIKLRKYGAEVKD